MSGSSLEGPGGYLTIQFLEWLLERPRTYGDTMAAWRTSCPRLSIWEDALAAGLVQLGDGRFRERKIVITDRGRLLLLAALGSEHRRTERLDK
jgi:hypothetical protein